MTTRTGANISGSAGRSRFLFVLALFVAIILVVALLLLEHGSSPVSPLGRTISASHPAASGGGGSAVFSDVTTTTDNLNAGCKPKKVDGPNCRPPSGG